MDLSFSDANGTNGSLNMANIPQIWIEINIISSTFLFWSSILISFHGSVSARNLFPSLAKSIRVLTDSLNLKLSKDFEIDSGYL